MSNGQVFISYQHIDQPIVKQLAADLCSAGADVWWDQDNLQCGEEWQVRVRQATRDSDFFIPCFSRHYKSGPTMEKEILEAAKVWRERSHEDLQWIFPVTLDDCKRPPVYLENKTSLADLHWVSINGSDRQPNVAALADVVTSKAGGRARELLVRLANDVDHAELAKANARIFQIETSFSEGSTGICSCPGPM